MHRTWFGIAAVAVSATLLLIASSCARNQHLISISVQPSGADFGGVDPLLVVNFKAFGAYEHPPQTKDITNQVKWESDTPQVAQVTSSGAVSPNTNCGKANVFATFNDGGNVIVSNAANITVDGPASLGCPQGGGTFNLLVSVTGGANGVIVSSPAGINCGSTCAAPFPAGSSVALIPTPNSGHTFGGWGVGCTSVIGNNCNVIMNSDVALTATFN
jgi:hypothetical protein